MEEILVEYLHNCFSELITKYDFRILEEYNDGYTYFIYYGSGDFVIQIEKYYNEFYLSLSKEKEGRPRISLFNLLKFLLQGQSDIPRPHYFRTEFNLTVSFQNQFIYLSNTLFDNYKLLESFFDEKGYEENIFQFNEYFGKIT